MMQQRERPSDVEDRAATDERYRIGYSSELFDALVTAGLTRGAHVLDAGCGSGSASELLVTRGIAVTAVDSSPQMLASTKRRVPGAQVVQADVECLPFADAAFDAVVSSQAFHRFDADAAFAQCVRVVKPGGTVAVWWKLLGADDPMRERRSAAAARAGVAPLSDPLRGGFSAFYRAAFASRSLRVLPFAARFTVDQWLDSERSEVSAREQYGARVDGFLEALRTELVTAYGSLNARFDVRYTQYLYVGQSAHSA